MMRSGFFTMTDVTYAVTEISEAGFYRIDFLDENGLFQVDPSSVRYSLVKKRKTFTIGDSTIYDNYLRLLARIEDTKMDVKKESEWRDGVFVNKEHHTSEKYKYTMDIEKRNGYLTYTAMSDGINTIVLTSDMNNRNSVKIEPINFGDYTELTLSKDTINTSGNSLFYDISTLRRRYNIEHLYKKNYCVATTVEQARERLNEFLTNPYPLRGFDTETTGLDVDMYGEDEMVGIILASDKNTSTYFPFRHKGDFNLPMSFLPEIIAALKKKANELVAHNGKFDRKVMRKEGYDIKYKWDTMQISIVLNPIIQKGAHGLKELMLKLTGDHYLELDEIFVSPKNIDFSVLPVDIILPYACPDGTDVLVLIEDQLKKLQKYQIPLVELECALSMVKADQEYFGIRVDTKKYTEAYENCNYIIDMLLKAFRTLTHEDGNINSPNVLLPLLYDKMHCDVLMRTKKGKPSTSSLAIKKLAKLKTDKPRNITESLCDMHGKVIVKADDLANARYPALVILAKYREYNKLKTAFYARFERTMKTGRVFFWVNQNGAATGRQSSPMHQLPPDLKEVILSDAPNRDFWGPDFSQIELRMIAYLAGETELIELAKNPDNDIHRIIGSLISNKEMWAITKQERSTGKRRNFGVVYLISAMGLAGQIFGPGYSKKDVEFCQQQLDDFYHKFKRIDRFIKHNAELVQKQGYMETAWYRRRRLFPKIFDDDLEPRERASILRQANNVPVQGTAADYLKLAEIQMQAYIEDKGWDKLVDGFPMVRQMLSIHDEIIISAHQDIDIEEIVKMITVCMETPVDEAPPFFVQPARMDNWEGHSDDSIAMPIKFRDKIIEDYEKTGKTIFKRGYYTIKVPDELNSELNSNTKFATASLVDKYLHKCSLVYDHGDNTLPVTEAQIKEALINYIESGTALHCVDNYRTLLNDYRNNDLKAYMLGLIKQYGDDYVIVGAHVRHPSLTHELLDYFKDELKGLDLTHEELITEAARLYLNELKNGDSNTAEVVTLHEVKMTDKDLFTEQLEATVNFDEYGNVVYYDGSDEDTDFEAYDTDPDPDSIIYTVNQTPTYVWEMADAVTYDVNGFTEEHVNQLLRYLYINKDDKGFYHQFLIYNNQMVDTKIRVENPNIDEANSLLVKLAEEERQLCGTLS